MTAGTGLRARDAAAEAGVNPQTLRYYERRGLLPAPARTPGGHRWYAPEAVGTVRRIKAAQRLGFTLDEMAALVRAGRGSGAGRASGPGLQAAARTKLGEIEARIADLTAVADALRSALEAGCDDLAACRRHPRCPLPLGPQDGTVRSARPDRG